VRRGKIDIARLEVLCSVQSGDILRQGPEDQVAHLLRRRKGHLSPPQQPLIKLRQELAVRARRNLIKI